MGKKVRKYKEVHYERGKLRSIEKMYKTDDPLDLLWLLMQESEERILKLVEKCYPDLPYLSYEDGQQAIQNSSLHADTKEQMLTLLDQMQRKQTIDKAVRYMEKNGYKTKSLLKRFQSLGLNPIPLRKGYAAKRMPSLLHILKSVGTQPVKIRHVLEAEIVHIKGVLDLFTLRKIVNYSS